MSARRVFVDLGAIACWIVLWCVSVAIGLDVGKKMVGPQGLDGYLALSGIVGVCFISPTALIVSIFLFLRAKRRIVVFILGAVPIGLAITLWPVLAWVFPWATW